MASIMLASLKPPSGSAWTGTGQAYTGISLDCYNLVKYVKRLRPVGHATANIDNGCMWGGHGKCCL